MANKKDGVKPFDLTNLDTSDAAEKGAVLEVLHPSDNTPLGIKITLAGADSDVYRQTVNKAVNKRVQRLRPGQSLPFTAEEQEESGLNLLATCTLAWEGVMVEGQELPCKFHLQVHRHRSAHRFLVKLQQPHSSFQLCS